MTTALRAHHPPRPAGEARRTPWSWAAAGSSLALSGLELGLAARGAEPQAYLVVVLLLGATTSGLAGAGVAVRNCVLSRFAAVTVAGGALAAVVLLATVGTPGSTGPEPLGATAMVAVALGVAVPSLVAADTARRSVRRVGCGRAGTGR